ncbi:MAG: DNA/RNA nuclease SfsA [Planctomycetota bacterium]|nr:MAG: DNA/RNA nuclease SfsA [Planctomycetota bacterium]
MRFSPPLTPATLLRRYKRFFADVELADGTVVVAHCTNTGRMTGCSDPGSACLIQPAPEDSKRKLRWTLSLVKVGRSWVSVDTMTPNRVVAEALRRRTIEALAAYDTVKTEVPYGPGKRSRIDMLLTDSAGALPPCYVEVKNTTLTDGNVALFPDAVSERATKHLNELAAEVGKGNRAVILPFVARGDCDAFDAAGEIDPVWASTLETALAAGVELLPLRARIDKRSVTLGAVLPYARRAGV